MVKVSMNIENARGAVASLNTVASDVEEAYNTLSSGGTFLGLPTTALANVPGDVQTLKDKSKFLDEKIDLTILINSNGGKNFPTSGTITYEVDKEATTIDEMEVELGKALAKNAEGFATSDFQENDPRLAGMQTYMEKYGSDNEVMGAFYDTLTPAGALALVNAVGDHVGYTHSVSEDESERAKSVLELLRLGLAAASEEWSGDKAKKYGENLVDAARNPDLKSKYSKKIIGSTEALNWFLYNNLGLSDSFVLGVAEKMDDIQQQDIKNGTPNGWEWTAPSRFLPAMVKESDGSWPLDTPASVFHALGKHPQASYKFFDGNARRMTYWTAQHYYTSQDLSGIAAAIDAASTDPAIMRKDPGGAATIASYGVNGIMGRSDIGPETMHIPKWGDAYFGMKGTEVAGSITHILQTYFHSVAETYKHPHVRPTEDSDHDGVADQTFPMTLPGGQDFANSPWFTKESLNKAFGIIGTDPQSMLTMRETLSKAETQGVSPDMSEKSSENMMTYWAEVEGSIANAIGSAAIDNAELKDKNAKAWIQLGTMGASELASKVPGGKVTSMAADAFIDWLAKEAEKEWANNASEEQKKQDEVTGQALQAYKNRLLFVYDEAGLNGYQNGVKNPKTGAPQYPLSATLGDAVVEEPAGSGNYRLITKQEFEALPGDKQTTVRNTLNTVAGTEEGWGSRVPEATVDATFQTGFEKRF